MQPILFRVTGDRGSEKNRSLEWDHRPRIQVWDSKHSSKTHPVLWAHCLQALENPACLETRANLLAAHCTISNVARCGCFVPCVLSLSGNGRPSGTESVFGCCRVGGMLSRAMRSVRCTRHDRSRARSRRLTPMTTSWGRCATPLPKLRPFAWALIRVHTSPALVEGN